MNKRLYRSQENKIIGGVCGGLGEYLGFDPTLVRIITVLLFILPGIGILAYVIAWIIIPMRPVGIALPDENYKLSPWNKYIPGLILIALGVFLMAREYWYWVDNDIIWSRLLILAGVGVILFGLNRHNKHTTNDINGQHININGES